MRQPLEKSPYSHNFQMLKYIGAWVIEPSDPLRLAAYSAYKLIMTLIAVLGLISLFTDLYLVFGDFKKVTWNLCISALFAAGLSKNIYTIHTNKIINRLRENLHEDAVSRSSPEDELIHGLAMKELRLIWMLFYLSSVLFLPAWLLSRYLSYLWGPKELPIPLRLPIDINLDDEFEYNYAFAAFGFVGVSGIFLVMQTEMGMFTILIQISREYRILLKDIVKINSLYEDFDRPELERKGRVPEVNPWLRKLKTKMLVKKFSRRQQKLIRYTEDFELSYSYSLLLQMFAMSLLVTVSAIQCILESGNISMNISYQMGYIFVLVVDMFLVCWFSTRIRSQCFKIGEVVYSTYWYRMATDIQMDICMMIMRSQRPPKLTSGKVMELNLHAFMLLMRNIYSWLALFQQLELKVN